MRKKIIMLPSEKPSNLYIGINYVNDGTPVEEMTKELRWSAAVNGDNNQHLYILSDEEIKKGDWYYNNTGRAIEQLKHLLPSDGKYCRKIIATTDDLVYKAVGGRGTFEYNALLPQIPQHIIEAYVKKPFDEVEVEYECLSSGHRTEIPLCQQPNPGSRYNKTHVGGISTYKPKLNQDGTLAVSLVEEKMYSREEVESMLILVYNLHECSLEQWIKENL